MTIYEPPQRNAGILGGKFMERTRVLRPGSSLSDPSGPSYYDLKDLFVGNMIEVLSHRFVLLDADEYVFNYMEADPSRFKLSDKKVIVEKAGKIIKNLNASAREAFQGQIYKADPQGKGLADRRAIVDVAKTVFGNTFSDHELITLVREYETSVRKVDYKKLLNSF